jgi:hypothetical protein
MRKTIVAIVWMILASSVIASTVHAGSPCVAFEWGVCGGTFAWVAAQSSEPENNNSTEIASGNRLQEAIGDVLDYSSHLKDYCEFVLKEVSSAKEWPREKWMKCVVEPLVTGVLAALRICLRAGPWWPIGVVVGIIVTVVYAMNYCF